MGSGPFDLDPSFLIPSHPHTDIADPTYLDRVHGAVPGQGPDVDLLAPPLGRQLEQLLALHLIDDGGGRERDGGRERRCVCECVWVRV